MLFLFSFAQEVCCFCELCITFKIVVGSFVPIVIWLAVIIVESPALSI